MIRRFFYLLAAILLLSSCSSKALSILYQGEERKSAPATFDFYPGETEFTDLVWEFGDGTEVIQVDAEITEDLGHIKGALAAARIGGPANPQKKSSGSQFYIVHGKPVDDQQIAQMEARLGLNYPENIRSSYLENGGTPFLDQDYTVFGQVVEGLDVVDQIAKVRTAPGDRPVEDVWMKVTVIK